MSNVGSEPKSSDWPRTLWGVLLSLFMPGLGHIYARSWRLGVILLAIGILLLAGIRLLTHLVPPFPGYFVIGAGLLICLMAFGVVAAVDAARRMRGRHARPRPGWCRSTWFAAIVSVAVSAGLGVVTPVGWRPFSIPSGSNLPTLLVGDRIVTDIRDAGIMPDRGEIVFFKFPRDTSVTYVKRLVGLPGDRIRIEHGQLSINGQPVAREAEGTFVAEDEGCVRHTSDTPRSCPMAAATRSCR
jgi:signal peptidase I